MRDDLVPLVIVDGVEKAAPDKIIRADRGAVRDLDAVASLEGFRDVPFRMLATALAKEENVVLCRKTQVSKQPVGL